MSITNQSQTCQASQGEDNGNDHYGHEDGDDDDITCLATYITIEHYNYRTL